MLKKKLISIILAAGKGSRIRNKTPKILLKINEKTLIHHAVDLAENFSQKINIIINKNFIFLKKKFPKHKFLIQNKLIGTGYALKVFFKKKIINKKNYFLVIYADTPFVKKTDIKKMIKKSSKFDLIILGFKTKNNKDCGLIKRNSNGSVNQIIEYKNSNQNDKKINICNSGVMLMSYKILKLSKEISRNELTKEYYLTDLIKIAQRKQFNVGLVISRDEIRSRGINDIKTYKKNINYLKK